MSKRRQPGPNRQAPFRCRPSGFFNLNFELKLNPAGPVPAPASVMSCVCILTPIVIAGWPAFSTAVAAAAASLGYSVLDAASAQVEAATAARNGVKLEIANSEVVTGTLGRDQRISVSRDGVIVTFSRDARGHASLCVSGKGRSDDQLRAAGEELSRAVVQSYVYQRLKDEMQAREFVLVEEERQADRSIRIKVRHWEN